MTPLSVSLPAGKIESTFGKMEVKKIISIGEPTLNPDRRVSGYCVPVKVEIESDGKIEEKSFDSVRVRPVNNEDQKDRWNIHGGI
jgi:hypothetical protein